MSPFLRLIRRASSTPCPPIVPVALITACMAVLALTLLPGCGGEDKNRAGYALLPPWVVNEQGASDTTIAGSFFDAAYHEADYELAMASVSAGGSLRLVVARSEGLESRALVHFPTPPLDTTLYRSAWIDLTMRGADSTFGHPRIVAYELAQPFTEGTTGTWGFPAYAAQSIAEGRFVPAVDTTAAHYRFGAGPGASSADSAAVTNLFFNWMRGTHLNAGLVFAIAPGDTGRVDLYTREGGLLFSPSRGPTAHIGYRLAGANSDSVATAVTDGDTFIAQQSSGSLAGVSGHLTVAAGVPTRSLLKFDLPTAMHGRLMHRVLLKLSVDPAMTFADTLLIQGVAVTDSLWDTAPAPATWAISGVTTKATGVVQSTLGTEGGVATLSLEITSMAREWSLDAAHNRGISLHAPDEYGNVSWIRFYGSSAPAALRPRLEIISSPIPGGGG